MNKLVPLALLCALGLLPTITRSRAPAPPQECRQPHHHHPAEEVPVDDGAIVSLTSRLSHRHLLEQGDREVFLCLDIAGAESTTESPMGMNLALVIDRSGSMASEQKLRHAKSAAQQLVGRLGADDRLALVVYDDEIQTLVPSLPVLDQGVFLDAIQALCSGGSTDLHGGMMAGYEEVLANADDERLNRVLLLSDGLANVGVKNPSAIWSRAEECRRRGVRISTMGMGLDYDEVLLQQIAQRSGGNYYYVAHPETVDDFLRKELDEMGRVIAKNPVVTVRLADGVELCEVYGYPHDRIGDDLTIPIGDVYGGERRKIVLRLRARHRGCAEAPVVQASIRYQVAAGGRTEVRSAPRLSVRYTADANQVRKTRNLEVLIKVEIVRDAEALIAAMALQQSGRIDAAQELLAERTLASRGVNEREYHSPEISRILDRMDAVNRQLTLTRSDPRAARDLQLDTNLTALGYIE